MRALTLTNDCAHTPAPENEINQKAGLTSVSLFPGQSRYISAQLSDAMKRSILIIDDSEEVRDNAKELLELSHYTVLTAADGKEGLEIINKKAPDLILCDVMMPELDGYGVLQGLLNNPHTNNVPFIFITSKAGKEDFRKGMDLGADDYLVKPFSGDQLLSMVSARLKKADTVRETLKHNLQDIGGFLKKAMPSEDIYKLGEKIVSKKLRKKDILYGEADAAKYLYYLVSGKVKTFRTNEQGKEYITQIYTPGNFFGYYSMLEAGVYADTALAMEDSEIACILKQDFYQMLVTNNELYAQFVNFITSELSESNDKLIKLAYNSARKRVAEAILFVAQKSGVSDTASSGFHVNRDDISAISGVSPESVSRNLTELRGERLIELHNGLIKILDLKKLRALKN